jgi:hypothetical protein
MFDLVMRQGPSEITARGELERLADEARACRERLEELGREVAELRAELEARASTEEPARKLQSVQ